MQFVPSLRVAKQFIRSLDPNQAENQLHPKTDRTDLTR